MQPFTKPIKKLAAIGLAALLSTTTAYAAENLTGETASPGGSIQLSMAHLAEVAAERDIANIQVADGQTLTNSVQTSPRARPTSPARPTSCPSCWPRVAGRTQSSARKRVRNSPPTFAHSIQ